MQELLVISYVGNFTWVGVYIGDKRVHQGHGEELYIHIPEAIQAAGGVSGASWVQWNDDDGKAGADWFTTERDGMGLPNSLSDIPKELLV